MTTLVAAEPKLIGGKYRVVAPLGQGAMGVVYRAEQLDARSYASLPCQLTIALTSRP